MSRVPGFGGTCREQGTRKDTSQNQAGPAWAAGSLLALSGGEGRRRADGWMGWDGISDGDGMEAVSLGAEKSWLLWSRSRTPWLVRAIRVRWMDRDVAI